MEDCFQVPDSRASDTGIPALLSEGVFVLEADKEMTLISFLSLLGFLLWEARWGS